MILRITLAACCAWLIVGALCTIIGTIVLFIIYLFA